MSENKDNMRIWNQFCETDPNYTKEVSLKHKFTTIDAYYQVKEVTEVFGPIGDKWSFKAKVQYITVGNFLFVACDTTIRYDDNKEYGPIPTIHAVVKTNKDGKLVINEDAPKSALTDGLTKGLSYLGVSADVFLGLFDDNKYVAELRQKYGNGNGKNTSKPPTQPNKQQTGKPQQSFDLISEKQANYLYIVAKNSGYSSEDVKRYLIVYGYESAKQIKKSQWKEIYEYFNARKAG